MSDADSDTSNTSDETPIRQKREKPSYQLVEIQTSVESLFVHIREIKDQISAIKQSTLPPTSSNIAAWKNIMDYASVIDDRAYHIRSAMRSAIDCSCHDGCDDECATKCFRCAIK